MASLSQNEAKTRSRLSVAKQKMPAKCQWECKVFKGGVKPLVEGNLTNLQEPRILANLNAVVCNFHSIPLKARSTMALL